MSNTNTDRAIEARDRSMRMARDGFNPEVGTKFVYRAPSGGDQIVTIRWQGLSHAGFNGMELAVGMPDGSAKAVCIGYLYPIEEIK